MDLLELRDDHEKQTGEKGIEAWHALARKVNSSTAYLSQIAHGHRKPSPRFAQRLVSAEPRLSLARLLPDVYGGHAA